MKYQNEEHFKDENGYVVDGAWYPRVTRILEIKSKPGLDSFFKEVGSYASAESIKNKSAAEGSLVHEVIQKIVTGIHVDIPESIRPAVDAFEVFNKERKIVFHPEFIEKRVWSKRYLYAGTIDALATIDGKFGVLDIKTSTGFYPEYNLQTAAYVNALQEFDVKRALSLPKNIETRWILRIDQDQACTKCSATLRTKGGREKVRSRAMNGCKIGAHEWKKAEGIIELREFPYHVRDMRAFIAAKVLWEWENDYWLRKFGYIT